MNPQYTNIGGTGDRTSIITVSTTMVTSNISNLNHLIDGNLANNDFYFLANPVAGLVLKFDFGSPKVITEMKYYQSDNSTQGTFNWQGSNDNSNWTNIGGNFALGGSTTQTNTTMSGNINYYRYYQILGISGVQSIGPYNQEIEFKIDNAPITAGQGNFLNNFIIFFSGHYRERGF